MLRIFKRSDKIDATPGAATRNAPSSKTDERRFLPRPIPTPEVVEGNSDADWALWEAFTRAQLEQENKPNPVEQQQIKKPSR